MTSRLLTSKQIHRRNRTITGNDHPFSCPIIITDIYYRPQRSCGKVMFLHMSVILFTGWGGLCPSMHHRLHDQASLSRRGLCLWRSLSRGSLSGGLCLGGFCLGVTVWGFSVWGFSVQGSLSRGSLSRGSLSRGVSVWGYLSGGVCLGVLCPDVSVQGGLCPGRSLSGGLCQGSLCRGESLSGGVSVQGECHICR